MVMTYGKYKLQKYMLLLMMVMVPVIWIDMTANSDYGGHEIRHDIFYQCGATHETIGCYNIHGERLGL